MKSSTPGLSPANAEFYRLVDYGADPNDATVTRLLDEWQKRAEAFSEAYPIDFQLPTDGR